MGSEEGKRKTLKCDTTKYCGSRKFSFGSKTEKKRMVIKKAEVKKLIHSYFK
jgi:hypothetical protein